MSPQEFEEALLEYGVYEEDDGSVPIPSLMSTNSLIEYIDKELAK